MQQEMKQVILTDENTAEEVFEISRNFLPVVKKLLTQLELKND